MLIYIFFLNWVFSMIFMFLNHPLSLGCVLLIQSILVSLASGFFYYNFWFSYILFLIMIGGMLVMFMYMTSIASNEKFKMPKNSLIFSLLSYMIILTLLFSDYFYSNLITPWSSFDTPMLMNFTLNKFLNYPNMKLMIMLMIYLLITLIAVVKIVGNKFGTLRQK